MFTGIVEELGKVKTIKRGAASMKLTVAADLITKDIHLGDSIAVNGVCLTVVSFTDQAFTVDVMPETIKATSLRDVKVGSFVNLERAMSANGRFGGHIVSGHIDGTGKIIRKQRVENAVYIDIAIDEGISQYCIPRGSIAIDGISLTIFALESRKVTVSLIPHTYEMTVLEMKKEQDTVNIETDMIGKYVIHHQERKRENTGVTYDLLQQHGF